MTIENISRPVWILLLPFVLFGGLCAGIAFGIAVAYVEWEKELRRKSTGVKA